MYKNIREINTGRFGKVVLCKKNNDSKDGLLHAVKIFRNKKRKNNEVYSSAALEKENFNNFSLKVRDIGKAFCINITAISNLNINQEYYMDQVLVMPYFENDRTPSDDEIYNYLKNILLPKKFYMGDPKKSNFFNTKAFGLIPV